MTMKNSKITDNRIINYLETLSLIDALWWFIENQEWSPDFTEAFFYLRTRVRRFKENEDKWLNRKPEKR